MAYEGGQAVSGAGAIIGGVAQYQQAQAQSAQLKWQAKQMKRNAKALLAEGYREAALEHKKGDKLRSRATAVMAAQGGGMDTERLADIEQQTDYNALAALYEGESAARSMRYGSEVKLNEADTAKRAGKMAVATGLMEGGAGMFGEWQRYKKNRDLKNPSSSMGSRLSVVSKPFGSYE